MMARLSCVGLRVTLGVLGLFAVLVATAVALEPGGEAPSPAEHPALEGLFTRGQATRGKVVYEEVCAACHGTDLEGGAAPPLTGRLLERNGYSPGRAGPPDFVPGDEGAASASNGPD